MCEWQWLQNMSLKALRKENIVTKNIWNILQEDEWVSMSIKKLFKILTKKNNNNKKEIIFFHKYRARQYPLSVRLHARQAEVNGLHGNKIKIFTKK